MKTIRKDSDTDIALTSFYTLYIHDLHNTASDNLRELEVTMHVCLIELCDMRCCTCHLPCPLCFPLASLRLRGFDSV